MFSQVRLSTPTAPQLERRGSHKSTPRDKVGEKGSGLGEKRRAASPPCAEEARRPTVTGRLIQTASSAYQFPLLFKHIWNTPLLQARDQEVVYRDAKRFTYV